VVPILDQHGSPIASSTHRTSAGRTAYVEKFSRTIRARYDAAKTTDDNERHWANADNLSANAAASPAIRKKIRSRARYEAQENNSYAKGMILTLANDMVGTGPKLQMLLKDREANQRIEASFLQWANEIRFAEKLRTMRAAKAIDGEPFAMLTTNPALRHDVKLDIRPFEADYVADPYEAANYESKREYDGIRYDDYGNPTDYFVLKHHPGSGVSFGRNSGNWVEASKILHIFREDRAGQRRGISEIATSLPLFAMLRRFTLATIAAAETAADFAAVMKTQANATTEAQDLGPDEWYEAIPLEYRAMLTLPNGWDITQLKAEHPTTTYQMFKSEIINEIARCLNMPYNVAAANSSNYNYASGRMDHQVYFKSIDVERHQWTCTILTKVFLAWLEEAMFVPSLLPRSMPPFSQLNWAWFWDAPEHVDPLKHANATKTNIESGTDNRRAVYGRKGIDVDQADEEAAAAYGVTVEEYRQKIFENTFSGAKNEPQIQQDQTQPQPAN
jgi:lambda family phage portal protein